MERIRGRDAGELISIALDWLPRSLARRLGFVHFFVGDPVFAGLHQIEVADDGGSFRTTAQYVPEHLQNHRPRSARRATIVLLFGPRRMDMVVHELGHALDDVLGEKWAAKPVSNYGRADRFEASAEAFTAWLDCPATRLSGTGSIGSIVTPPTSSMPSPGSCRLQSLLGI